MEPVLELFSFHLAVMGLRGFCSVPSALPSQEGCADLIIDQDNLSLRTTASSQLYDKSPYPLLAKVQHHIASVLNGPASSLAVSEPAIGHAEL